MSANTITYRQAERKILEVLANDAQVARHGFRVDMQMPGLVAEYVGNVVCRIIIPEGRIDDAIRASATLHWVGKLWAEGEEEWGRAAPFLLNTTDEGKWGFAFNELYQLIQEAEQQGTQKPWLWQRQEYEVLANRLRTEFGVDVKLNKSLVPPRHYWLEVRHGEALVRIRGLDEQGKCQVGLLCNGHVNDLSRLIEYMKRNPQALVDNGLPEVKLDDGLLRELAAVS